MVKRIKSSALLCGSTPNNCSAVYQKELALLLIQASPHPLLIVFLQPTQRTYLIRLKKAVVKKLYEINLTEYQR